MNQSLALAIKSHGIRDHIARHPLASFVMLSYLISWVSWSLIQFTDTGSVNGLSIIGVTGPALSATVISAILGSESSGIPQIKRRKLFGIIWVGYLALLLFRRFWMTNELTTLEGRVITNVIYPNVWAWLLDAFAAAVVPL